MARRCILGCGSPGTLFPIPKNPWLRTRWLDFLHFEEGGISDRSRLCSKHFTRESFRNWTQHEMGFVRYLSLTDRAIPSVYTVGTSNHTSQSLTPLTRDVACQCDAPSLKSVSIQTETQKQKRRSKAIQVKPCVHSVGMSVGIGIEPPCFTSTPIKKPRMEDITFDESSTCISELSDVTYEPDITQETSEKVCQPLYKARKYMVYEDNLLELFQKCPACCHTCRVEKFINGTFVSITQVCAHCSHKTQWNSQPHIGNAPAGNLHLSAAVAFNGASYIQIHKVLSALCLECICPRTFFNHQKALLQPTILWQWRSEQNALLEKARHSGKAVVLGGDMRADSPGHCAKYGSYTMMDLDDNKVVDIQLIQSNEVGGSPRMEREGFLRSLQFLESAGLRVGAVVTDRHPSIQKYLREQRPEIQHYYDTWHVSKGLAKKIDALGKERNCGEVLAWRKSIINHLYWCASSSKTGEEAVEKWKSVTNHVQNVHHHSSDLFPVCAHPPLERRAWLTPSTKACERFCDLVINKRLLKDVAKLSPQHQTSSVEGFHSLILKFAPKNVPFSFVGMLNRLLLAALHYNENGNRELACNQSGEPSIRIKWPKYKKGEHSLFYIKTAPTYNYVETLLRLLFEEVVFNPDPYQELVNELKVPDPLCAAFDRPDLLEAGVRPWSRFSHMEQEP